MDLNLVTRRSARVMAFIGRTALAAAIMFAVGGCSDADTAQPQARGAAQNTSPVRVTVAPVTVAAAQRTIDTVGTLYGDEEATISAKVPGRIVSILHDIGDRVESGQPLAQIETRDYELARSQRQLAVREALSKLGLMEFPPDNFDPDSLPTVRKAKFEAENAEARFNRGKQLYEQQPPRLSEQEYADLQTAFEVARNEYQVQVLTVHSTLAQARARQADLELAEQQLVDATVRAPSASEGGAQREYAISARLVSVGEYVSIGTALFRLVDDDPIKLRCDIPERFAAEVRVGQPVRVTVDAFERAFLGTVTRISPQVDPTHRNFRVEAVIDNPQHLLKPGAFARASIQTRTEENVLFVPASAVVSFAGVNRIYIAEDGKAVERIVTLGIRRGDDVEVRKGLKPGEMIVTGGGEKLSQGMALEASTLETQ